MTLLASTAPFLLGPLRRRLAASVSSSITVASSLPPPSPQAPAQHHLASGIDISALRCRSFSYTSGSSNLQAPAFSSSSSSSAGLTPAMTTGVFKYIDRASYDPTATKHPQKAWGKVDDGGKSFILKDYERAVTDIRSNESTPFHTDTTGFAVYHSPATEKKFDEDATVRSSYYPEVEALIRQQLPGVKKVVVFDHTIRRRNKDSPRQPVQQVHVDQTPAAAEVRVRRHIQDSAEAEELLKKRYAIINVWRPIENPATDYPLAVIDWRTTSRDDFVPVDLLYPKRKDSGVGESTVAANDDDDRGKEKPPNPEDLGRTDNYEVKGETYAVAPSDKHHFYYAKDMTPDEALFLKCFDSHSEWSPNGRKGVAHGTPHTAFVDGATPAGTPGRQSIEVRCLVFYE